MESIVLLNADYTPLTVVRLRRAINLIIKKKAVVVEATTRIIQNTEHTFTLAVPRVIRLIEYVKNLGRINVHPTKKNILLRDGYCCAYCGKTISTTGAKLTIDHIVPTSRGGKTTFENCVTACFECNNRKNNRTPEEASMTLKVKPYRPSLLQFIQLKMRNSGVSDSLNYDSMQ